MSKIFTKDRFLPFVSGAIMTINFLIFWAIPVMGMGSFYKQLLKPFLQPIYLFMESNSMLRNLAAKYIYSKADHADFFPLSLLLVINCSLTIPYVFYYQLTHGSLPPWMIFAYYCSWVGIGGSMMGAAYALAHREGHNPRLYKKSITAIFGNFFENILGPFFGNIPWTFTTSHVKIHHAVNGGFGDTFYLWDFDRSNLSEFMLYIHRIFLHMIGYSSIRYFRANGRVDKADLLSNGVMTYAALGVGILALTRSFAFLWWIYIEPLLCMTYFLALLNIGFHGMLEFDDEGNHIAVVDSSTIIDGEDDVFGEDDHMTHHYNTGVYFKDLKEHQNSKIEDFKKHRATVFRTISIVELSIFTLLGLWDKLAEYYVDYTGKMTHKEIAEMLKVRAKRQETSYERYEAYLRNPTPEARQLLRAEANKTNYLPPGCSPMDVCSAPSAAPPGKASSLAFGSSSSSTTGGAGGQQGDLTLSFLHMD